MAKIAEPGKSCSCQCQEDKKHQSHRVLKGIKLVLVSLILLLNLTLFVKAFIVLRDYEERISALEVNSKYPVSDISVHDIISSRRIQRDTDCYCPSGPPGKNLSKDTRNVSDLSAVFSICCIKGDLCPGLAGRPGKPGIPGPKGATGLTGLPGLDGLVPEDLEELLVKME
jgi:hypothetical protein